MAKLRRSKVLLILAAALTMSLVFAACSTQAPPSQTKPAAPASKAAPPAEKAAAPAEKPAAKAEPYRIGALYSQTGNLATYDVVASKGVKLLAEKINKAGGVNGHPLEIIMYDPESKPEQVVALAKKLIQQDKVIAIVGPSATAQAGPLVPIVNEAKIPNVAQQGSMLLNSKHPYAFSSMSSGLVVAEVALAWAQKKGIKKIGMLTRGDVMGEVAMPMTEPALKKTGITLVGTEKYLVTDKDMTVQLSKLKAAGSESIWNYATGRDVAIVAKNFQQLGMPGYLLVPAPTLDLIDAAGEAGSVLHGPVIKSSVWSELPDSDPAKKPLAEFA
ncbi:MAG: ABC transporter substrate-binding protein [Chloroflexi bacterium]|nr:ABC transporter substrate-binding protein [Chloroflexota bacterium]